jgi:hypothetical protein
MKYHTSKSSKRDKSKGGGNGTSSKKSIFKPKSKKEYKFTPWDSSSSVAQASYASVKEHLLLVYIQKEFGTGMLDVYYDSIDREAMIDLNKELPVVRTSNNKDEKIAENENKAYMYDYRDDMKVHKQMPLRRTWPRPMASSGMTI